MTEPILSVRNVSKVYQRHRNNWARLATWLGIRKPGADVDQVFWANRNISFAVQPGEALAIIGQNGAGKSTLLKMITGTVRPSQGTITVGGRVSSLLELGIGFNPELTGRQNIFMAGGLMGLSQARLKELVPSMEAFAEIGDFFDAPLRVYSSGMQARLAFALATCERPDVLIVDEILSVGDSYFQHKSFDRIRQFKEEGSSIIMVTHSLGDVRSLCERAILLDKGVVLKDGQPDEVVDFYNALVATKENELALINQSRTGKGWLKTTSGTLEAHVVQIRLLNQQGAEVKVVAVGQKLVAELDVRSEQDLDSLVLGFGIKDRLGNLIFGTNTDYTKQKLSNLKADDQITFQVAFDANLGVGSFAIHCSLVPNDSHIEKNYQWIDNGFVFDVINVDKPQFAGLSWNPLEFSATINNKPALLPTHARDQNKLLAE